MPRDTRWLIPCLAAGLLDVAACAPSAHVAEDPPADAGQAVGEPLPSWNDSGSKQAILDFVATVTDPDSPDFVPEPERVATFDNDGCLWAERPVYFQLLFALDRVEQLAPEHPEWQSRQPFKGVLEGDLEAVAATGMEGLAQIVMASHAGMTTEEFAAVGSSWLATARHPDTGRLYTEMVYQPMLELLDYLRAKGFKTFIVSGGGVDLIRLFSEEVYGIPPEQVVGSSIETAYEVTEDGPVIRRLPEIDFIDDKEGKPVGIHKFIGRRPSVAFGNSDGDFQMLEWTTAGDGARLGVLIHHTDAEREWAYDRDSHVGRLDRGLDEAAARGWVLVDMKDDWSTIFPRSGA